MHKKKISGLVIVASIIGIAGSAAYLFYKPHRNVQETVVFADIKVSELVNEFSTDAAGANAKYLSADGNSKVLVIEGRVSNISTNQSGEKVIILSDEESRTGVSATFTTATNANTELVKPGDTVKIKGAITAGNSYDEDLDVYEYATMVQCDIVK